MEENKNKMNASVESSSSEKTILSEEHGKDIISYLPEEILSHFLSFLSTNDAIRTSVLSKRWQYVWTSLSDFVLNEWENLGKETISETAILDFLDRIFTLHDPSDIKRFHLTLCLPVCYSRLERWIRGAVEHNVQDLKLEVFTSSGDRTFSWCSFASHSMVMLRILAHFPLKATEPTLFPNLKTLHLCKITFSDELSAQHIFSGCLVLEELSLVNCKWKYVKDVMISIPTLKSLTIEDYNVHGDVLNCVIKISAANLKFFKCFTDLQLDICFREFSCLEHAEIDLQCRGKWEEETSLQVFRLFSGVRNTKSLKISNGTLLFLKGLKFGIFSITHLKVNKCIHSSFLGILLEFLEETPKLEHLHLAGVIDNVFVRDVVRNDLNCFKSLWSKRWEQRATLSITYE